MVCIGTPLESSSGLCPTVGPSRSSAQQTGALKLSSLRSQSPVSNQLRRTLRPRCSCTPYTLPLSLFCTTTAREVEGSSLEIDGRNHTKTTSCVEGEPMCFNKLISRSTRWFFERAYHTVPPAYLSTLINDCPTRRVRPVQVIPAPPQTGARIMEDCYQLPISL